MYQIKCDNVIIHDPRIKNLRVIEPVCELGLNKTGSLTFLISSNNPHYDDICKLKSEISLYQDGEWLFSGRVLNDEIKFNKVKQIQCEGEFAYFLDSIQRNAEYHVVDDGDKNKVQIFLEQLVDVHNNQVEDKKKFIVGNVTVKDTTPQLYKYTSFQTTHTCLKEKLIDTFGGYFIPKNKNGIKYIDYLDNDNLNINSQVIKFGENIIDMTQFIRGEDIATAIIPRGKKLSDNTVDGEKIETRLDISSIEDSIDETIVKQDDFIYDIEAVEKYGWIYKVIEWEDVSDVNNLFEKAKEQLNYYKQQAFNIELTAIDLHLLDVNVESIKIGDKIRVISLPHKLDVYMIVNEITINIDKPENTTIELISEERFNVINTSSDNTVNNTNKVDSVEKDFILTKDNYDDKFNEYDEKFNEYDENLYNNMNDYLDNNFDTKLNEYLNSGSINLDGYAKEVDVTNAFNELATLLNEV